MFRLSVPSRLVSSFALFALAGCTDVVTVSNPRNPLGAGPASLELGLAVNPAAPGSFVLLGKTAITNATGSKISGGDVGLSPAAASYLVGFSPVADGSNVFSTSIAVAAPGKIFAADYAVPTPANLTTAILAMEAAYADAAGRSPPDFLNVGAGNLGGLTLAPGLYTWGTSLTIPADVTFAGGANDVWILQVAGDLDIATAKHVILSGGARADHIFWQVAGQTVVHANAAFAGIILCKTAISFQTNASLIGRAFAQTMVALDDNAMTAP
jgi:hypothetical protein